MPTPGSDASSLATPSLKGGSSLARPGGQIRVPRSRHPWTYVASAGLLQCLRGEIVPRLLRADWTPGQQGNGRSLTTGEGARAWFMGQGFVEIPHDFPTEAWGKPVVSDYSSYLVATRGVVSDDIPVVYHHEVWKRPSRLGHDIRWKWDDDGWLKFLVDIRDKLLAPNGVSEEQVEIAINPIATRIRRLAARDDSGAKTRLLTQALAQLPRAHAPADILPLFPKTPKRRGGTAAK